MPTTVAILNQKGGVGKTTTAVTLASGLARKNYKYSWSTWTPRVMWPTAWGWRTATICAGCSPRPKCSLDQAVTPSGVDNLDVIRSDKSTTALKQTLAGVTLREYILADVLQNSGYDLIVLTAPPRWTCCILPPWSLPITC